MGVVGLKRGVVLEGLADNRADDPKFMNGGAQKRRFVKFFCWGGPRQDRIGWMDENMSLGDFTRCI